MYAMAADGSGQVERLTENAENETPSSITPDGSQLVARRDSANTAQDLIVMSLAGARVKTPLLQSKFNERNGEVSPNGKWLAYDSNESGTYEVYVRPFPNSQGGRWPISSGGGSQPVWTRDGRELIYAVPANRLMGVSITGGGTFAASAPHVIVEVKRFFGTLARTYDVSPDGKRFLIIEEGEDTAATGAANMIVVTNWLEDLKRLLREPK